MLRKHAIKKQLDNCNRRLQILQEQQSSFGRLHTPVHILTQIEDTEIEIEELEMKLRGLKDNDIENGDPNLRIQIIQEGNYSSLSEDLLSAAISAFAAVIQISPQDVKVYRIYEGSVVFDLGIPSKAFFYLRSLLQSNSPKFHQLRVEKFVLINNSGSVEEWVSKDGKFDLVTISHQTKADNIYEKKPIDGSFSNKALPKLSLTMQGDVVTSNRIALPTMLSLDYIGLSSLIATQLELDTEDADFITVEIQWLFSAVDYLLGICENKIEPSQPIPTAIPPDAETLPQANNRLLLEPANTILFEDTLDHLGRIDTRWQLKVKRELTAYTNRLNSSWRVLQLSIQREAQLGAAGKANPTIQAQIKTALANLIDALCDMATLMQQAFGILVTSPAQLRNAVTQL